MLLAALRSTDPSAASSKMGAVCIYVHSVEDCDVHYMGMIIPMNKYHIITMGEQINHMEKRKISGSDMISIGSPSKKTALRIEFPDI